jgi:hypothetical protein
MFIKTFAPGQYFQAGMLKEKQGILDGVDNRFGMVFSVFIDIIMTESGPMSTGKIIFFALDFWHGAGSTARAKLVPKEGVEPSRLFGQRILSP